MIRIDDAIIARLKKGGEVFEVLVDCDKALEYKAGMLDSLDDVLATTDIFSDVKQGEHASEHAMLKHLHTQDPKEVASMIIKEGEVQLTTDHKNKLREDKRKQILQHIRRNAVDAQTGTPFTIERLEMVMEEAKVKIDEFKPAESQVQEVITKMRPLIPIKIETREIEVAIPSKFAGAALNGLQKFGNVLKQDWQNDGGLKVVIDIPGGMQEEMENALNKLTHGDVEIKVIEKK